MVLALFLEGVSLWISNLRGTSNLLVKIIFGVHPQSQWCACNLWACSNLRIKSYLAERWEWRRHRHCSPVWSPSCPYRWNLVVVARSRLSVSWQCDTWSGIARLLGDTHSVWVLDLRWLNRPSGNRACLPCLFGNCIPPSQLEIQWCNDHVSCNDTRCLDGCSLMALHLMAWDQIWPAIISWEIWESSVETNLIQSVAAVKTQWYWTHLDASTRGLLCWEFSMWRCGRNCHPGCNTLIELLKPVQSYQTWI